MCKQKPSDISNFFPQSQVRTRERKTKTKEQFIHSELVLCRLQKHLILWIRFEFPNKYKERRKQ